jgi:hypothetical protein
MDVIQEHPVRGYKLLEDADNIPQSVKLSVFQHHERLAGSGYPLGLAGRDIADFARIIAVADIYDAMSSQRVYGGALNPFGVVAEVFGEMFTGLDPPSPCPSSATYATRSSASSSACRRQRGQSRLPRPERPAQPVVKLAAGGYIDLKKERI